MQSVKALMRHIVDYAGLFPPAKLDMASTARNYASYIDSEDTWMLGRLIVPVKRFEEFETTACDLLPHHQDAEPWLISALTAPAGADGFEADLVQIASFNERHASPADGLVQIDVIELRADAVEDIDDTLDALPDELYPFFEMDITSDPRGLIAALAGSDAGAKVRTGGVTADAFPTIPDLARFIIACAQTGLPFKATAGLHHPLRHHAKDMQTRMHGFLNVFLGAALAGRFEISASELEAVLGEENLESFGIDETGISWQDLRLDVEDLEDTRLALATSFGSCSFDEPRDDLRLLKLL